MPIRTILDAQWTPKGRLEPIKTKKTKRSPNFPAPKIEQNPAKTGQRPPKDDFKSKNVDKTDKIGKRYKTDQNFINLWIISPCFDVVFHM